MENNKNFNVIEGLKLMVDGKVFDPNEYGRPYEENPDENYLPYEIQRWWFENVYPNGRIVVSKPEQDPEHNPGVYVSTAMIWKDKNDEKEDICISSRSTPSEGSLIDPYQDCQRKAISAALRTLGFWVTPSKVVVKPMVNPDEKEIVKVEKVESPTVEEPKKRGRKSKAEKEAEELKKQEAAKTLKEETTEATAEETKENSVEETVSKEVPVVEEKEESIKTVESETTENTESINEEDIEKARAVVVQYRNYKGKTIGELADSSEPRDNDLLQWFATSDRALKTYKEEAEAAKIVLAAKK